MNRLFFEVYRYSFGLILICFSAVFLCGNKSEGSSDLQGESEVLKVDAKCELESDFVVYKFYLNENLVHIYIDDFRPLYPNDSPIGVYCDEDFAVLITKLGRMCFLKGLNLAHLLKSPFKINVPNSHKSRNRNEVSINKEEFLKILDNKDAELSIISITRSVGVNLEELKDYVVDYIVDEMEDKEYKKRFRGVYLFTKKGRLIYYNFRKEGIDGKDSPEDDSSFYSIASYKNEKPKFYMHNGVLFVLLAKGIDVIRFSNGKVTKLSADYFSNEFKDYAVENIVDEREEKKGKKEFKGIYLFTKKKDLFYLSLNTEDIYNKRRTSYRYAAKSYENEKPKFHIYNGFLFVLLSDRLEVMRYDGGKKTLYKFFYFDKQKAEIIQEDNVIHIWGKKEGIIVQFIVGSDYIEIYRWGEKEVVKINGNAEDKKEETE